MGVINILNRAYVVQRRGPADPDLRAATARYAAFRIGQFALGAKSQYGRDRLAGARAAYSVLPELFASPPQLLDEVYLRLRAACL